MKCSYCNRNFQREKMFYKHLAKVHKVNIDYNKTFQCSYCDKEFSSKFNMTRHEAIHCRKSFNCKHCKASFDAKMKLIEHYRSCQKGRKGMMYRKISVSKKTEPIKAIKEGISVKAIANKLNVSNKVIYCWLKSQPNHKSKKRAYKCLICQRVFTRLNYYRKHSQCHALQQCEYCENKYHISVLSRHIRCSHPHFSPKYICDICGRKVSTKTILKCHIERHNSAKFRCINKCGYETNCNENLKKHSKGCNINRKGKRGSYKTSSIRKKRKIVSLIESGETYSNIEKRFGVPSRKAKRWLKVSDTIFKDRVQTNRSVKGSGRKDDKWWASIQPRLLEEVKDLRQKELIVNNATILSLIHKLCVEQNIKIPERTDIDKMIQRFKKIIHGQLKSQQISLYFKRWGGPKTFKPVTRH